MLTDVPLFDDEVFKLLTRFVLDAIFVSLLIGWAYYPHQKKKNYVFAFFLMNIMVFFICFALKKLDLGLGMALGLFAVFGILRFRTVTIKVKEMTYLFLVVGIAVINALSNGSTSYAELLIGNSFILLSAVSLERICRPSQLGRRSLVYDNLELLQPHRRDALVADLTQRTGLNITNVDVNRIDLKRKSAEITAYFEPQEGGSSPS